MIKEMKKLYKKCTSIHFTLEESKFEKFYSAKATIIMCWDTKDKDFSDQTVTLRKEFNSFLGRLPSNLKKISFHASLYHYNKCYEGNIGVFFSVIKEGDKLIFRYLDNKNQYCDAAIIPENCFDYHNKQWKGLHMDTLYVDVKRNNRYVIKDFELINKGPCPDNKARNLMKR